MYNETAEWPLSLEIGILIVLRCPTDDVLYTPLFPGLTATCIFKQFECSLIARVEDTDWRLSQSCVDFLGVTLVKNEIAKT